MALRKLAGPFEFKDLFGDYHEAGIGNWVDELDGFLSEGSWRTDTSNSTASSANGYGLLQLDGVFVPRVSVAASLTPSSSDGPNWPYDRATGMLADYEAGYTGSPDPVGYYLNIYRGKDWFTLETPSAPVTVELTLAAVAGHTIDPFTFALLPDRVLFLGKVNSSSPPITKIFSVAYTAAPFAAPIEECTLQTALLPGSVTWEDWYPGSSDTRFISSSTPERSVFIVRKGTTSNVRALEYDFLQNKVVGWVRRLGVQPEMAEYPGSPVAGQVPAFLAGLSIRNKVWAVTETASYPYAVAPLDEAPQGPWAAVNYRARLWIFADEATPATLSNPIALSPTAAGEVVRYQVRLLGADYEPCIGHKVNWSCSNLGIVQILQSETDENGYAETLVAYPPRWEGPWEGATITAEVVF